MSQEIVRREPSRAVATMSTDQLRYIAGTEFVPKGLRGNLPAILACVRTGREIGIGDMEALRSIHVIDGRPSMSAELMVKLVRRAGHSISGTTGDGKASVTGRRADTGDQMTVEWTHDMAVRAGLTSKANWQKYEPSMLWARAASQLCRMLFPDCLGGVSHTPDEVELTAEERVDEALGNVVAPPSPGPDDGDEADAEHVVGEVVEEPSLEAPEFAAPGEVAEDPVVQAALAASEWVIPNGQNAGKTLADLQQGGERGEQWLGWALGHVTEPAEYRDALFAYARVFYPDLYAQHQDVDA